MVLLLAHRFGEFEKFVYEFLIGSSNGGRSSGEGLRLKLQTPLFVADALMEAAGRQLEAERQLAQGELNSLRMVRQQVGKFEVRLCIVWALLSVVCTQ